MEKDLINRWIEAQTKLITVKRGQTVQGAILEDIVKKQEKEDKLKKRVQKQDIILESIKSRNVVPFMLEKFLYP